MIVQKRWQQPSSIIEMKWDWDGTPNRDSTKVKPSPSSESQEEINLKCIRELVDNLVQMSCETMSIGCNKCRNPNAHTITIKWRRNDTHVRQHQHRRGIITLLWHRKRDTIRTTTRTTAAAKYDYWADKRLKLQSRNNEQKDGVYGSEIGHG